MNALDIAVPLDTQARKEWIKYQLRLRGSSLAKIARELGINRHNCHNALVRRPYPRVQRAMAAKLGLQPHQLWPEWYHPDGTRKRVKPGPQERADKDTSDGASHNVRRGEAA